MKAFVSLGSEKGWKCSVAEGGIRQHWLQILTTGEKKFININTCLCQSFTYLLFEMLNKTINNLTFNHNVCLTKRQIIDLQTSYQNHTFQASVLYSIIRVDVTFRPSFIMILFFMFRNVCAIIELQYNMHRKIG